MAQLQQQTMLHNTSSLRFVEFLTQIQAPIVAPRTSRPRRYTSRTSYPFLVKMTPLQNYPAYNSLRKYNQNTFLLLPRTARALPESLEAPRLGFTISGQ